MVAVFFNQYVNPIAMGAIGWKYYICYCCFLGFELYFIYFWVVETRYVPMEEIAKYFDGDNADVVELTHAQTKGVMAEEGTAQQVEDKNTSVEVKRIA